MGITLLVGTEKGAFVCGSRDRRTWRVEGPLFKGWKVTASARTPSGRYLVATASQVYGAALHASTDLEEWHQIEKGPAYAEGGDRKMNQIWTFAAAGKRLYAGVDTAGLFASDDDGETWQPVPGLNDHPTRASWFPGAGGLCAHAVIARGERIWVGISAVGVWRSDDGGKTWQPRNAGVRKVIEDQTYAEIGFCVHGLAPDPKEPGTIYRQDHTGFYVTTDGGDTWEKRMEGLPSWFGFPVAIDPRTGHLFVFPMESDEYRVPVDGKFRIYRSRDGAKTWEPLGEGLPTGPHYGGVLRGAMAVDGLDPGGVYVGATSGQLFATADGGDTWRELPCVLPRILHVAAYTGT